MKKLKIAFAAAALFAVGTLSAQDLSSVQTKFTDAAAALQAREFDKAATLFEQVISEGTNIAGADEFVSGAKQYVAVAMLRSGLMQAQNRNFESAAQIISRAAELAELYGDMKTLTDARSRIGQVVSAQGAEAFNNKDFAAAAVIFQKGYDTNPNDTNVAMNLAMSYIGLKEYAKGNEIYRHIISLEDQDARFAEAAAKARQQFAMDNLALAATSAQAEQFDAAIAAVEELLATVPDYAPAHLLRLQAYNSMKQYARVIELGDAAVAAQLADEDRSTANFLIGAAYQNRENYAKAIEYYRGVVTGAHVAAAKAQITELQKLAN